MNKYLMYKYFSKLSIDDIRNLSIKYNIFLSDIELDDVYNYVKNNYEDYFNGKISYDDIIVSASKILSDDNYNKLSFLFSKYKEYI